MTEKHKYPSPLYAAAGIGDLAAEKLRELPGRVNDVREWAREEFGGDREKARADLAELGGRIGHGLATVRTRVQSLSEADLRELRGNARKRAGEFADVAARNLVTAQDRATHLYEDLVTRGSGVLDTPAPAELPEPKPAKKMAKKATRPAARKSADK
ncbi:hypothetical protein [Actinocatenispora rupis]|uniref:Uncharacterized protein n=1 Tax=Actinocatenispora rupis TaxID=519421 RepID=A0A8J3NGR4_9ACTN|nr:hypothetical protein [Actinocatenispora rupis]GID15134.1 hypothetical protein Aru02nite_60230 [Actinocatenispora rupis]